MSASIRDYFEADHDRLDDLLKEYQNQKEVDFQRAKSALIEFKLGLERHIVWEEEILFPVFESKSGISWPPRSRS